MRYLLLHDLPHLPTCLDGMTILFLGHKNGEVGKDRVDESGWVPVTGAEYGGPGLELG